MGKEDWDDFNNEELNPAPENKTKKEPEKSQSDKTDKEVTEVVTSKPAYSRELFSLKTRLEEISNTVSNLNREKRQEQAFVNVIDSLNIIARLTICPECKIVFSYLVQNKNNSEEIGLPSLIDEKAYFKCPNCNREFENVTTLTGQLVKAKKYFRSINKEEENEEQEPDEENQE